MQSRFCPTTKERTISSWKPFKPTSKVWSSRKTCGMWTKRHSNCIDIANSVMTLTNLWSHSTLSLHDPFTDIISIISRALTLSRPRYLPLLLHRSDGKDARKAPSSPHLWITCDPQYDSRFLWKCSQGDRRFRFWRPCLHLGWQIWVFIWHSVTYFRRIAQLAGIMVTICLHSCWLFSLLILTFWKFLIEVGSSLKPFCCTH